MNLYCYKVETLCQYAFCIKTSQIREYCYSLPDTHRSVNLNFPVGMECAFSRWTIIMQTCSYIVYYGI